MHRLRRSSGSSGVILAALTIAAPCFGSSETQDGVVHVDAAGNVKAETQDGVVHVDAAGNVKVGGKVWLEAQAARYYCHGEWHSLSSSGDATTRIIPSTTTHTEGVDALGTFSEDATAWSVLNGNDVVLALKTYTGNNTYVFEQRLTKGCSKIEASTPVLPAHNVDYGDNVHPGLTPPFVSYPAWKGDGGIVRDLRYLTWQGGDHATYQWTVQESHGVGITKSKDDGTFMGLAGLSAGPAILFGNATSGESPSAIASRTAIAIGPLTNVKLATSVMSRENNATWEMGVSAEIKSAPAGFVHRTLLVVSTGPTRAMLAWGKLAQKSANLTERFRDIATTKLGYFTDNGAMLYGDAYKHDLDCCNATVLTAVKDGLDADHIPIHWIQMDDWWYKGYLPDGGGVWCVHDWLPDPQAFPQGLDGVQTNLPWLLYAPFFCANSTFVKEDREGMLVSAGGYAVPTPAKSKLFYEKLFALYPGKRMAGYEVDFMNDNFLNQLTFRQELGASEGWLDGMHAAAVDRGISIQYCMPLPSDLLASLQHSHVTNYRASDDYAGSSVTNYNIQTSSLLGWSLGLRPSKDVFFTTDNAPNNPYIKRLNKNHPTVPGVDLELNALIATLSTGPVAMGDGAGATNRALIMRSCTEDGSLLQPEKPLTGIDAMYDGRGRPPGGIPIAGGAQVWTTYSEVTTTTSAPPSASSTAFRSGTTNAASTTASSAVQSYMLVSIDVEGPYFAVDTELDFYPGFSSASATAAAAAKDTRDDAEGAHSTATASSNSSSSKHVYIWEHDVKSSKCANGTASVVKTGCVTTMMPALDDTGRPHLQSFDSHKWSLLHVMPVLANGMVFLGELGSKWVPVSGARFSGVDAPATTLKMLVVTASCTPGEVLHVGALAMNSNPSGDWTMLTQEVKCSDSSGKQRICFGHC